MEGKQGDLCGQTAPRTKMNMFAGRRNRSATYLQHPVTVVLYGALTGDVEPGQLRL